MNEPADDSIEEDRQRSLDLLGVIAVLCLAVFPAIYDAIAAWYLKIEVSVGFHYLTTSLIVRSIQVSLPLLLIVKLSKIEWEAIGLQQIRWSRDVASGIGLWLMGTMGFYIAFYIVYFTLPESWLSVEEPESMFEGPEDAMDYGLVLLVSCANGFAEELVMRGYLLTRIERLLKSTWAALLITTLLFAAYHLYQGAGAAIGIAGLGLIYGGAFCLWRRLWPLVIAHAIADFGGLIMM